MGHTLEWGRPKLGSSRQDYHIDKVRSIISELWLIIPSSLQVVGNNPCLCPNFQIISLFFLIPSFILACKCKWIGILVYAVSL